MLKNVLLSAAIFVSQTVAWADNWPGWRGPTGMGLASESNLPVQWSSTKNIRWRAPVQATGASTPVVWNEHIFLTASDGRLHERLHVFAYGRDDGKLLWHTRLFGTAPTDLYPSGGMAVPTPVTDGKYLYVLFGTGDLVCLDFEGKPVWIRSLAQEYGPFQNRWGMATSPILIGDLLVIQVDHWSQSYLLAVEARTGATRWKKDRDAGVNWSSPIALQLGGRPELIVFGTYRATGYDAETGSPRWTINGLDLQCIPSPVLSDGLLIASSTMNTSAVRLTGKSGELTAADRAWVNSKGAAYIASPLAYSGRVYIAGAHGIGTCLDVKTGELVWRKRLGETYFASPVAGDGMIYFAGSNGAVHVVRAGRTFELLAQNELGESIVASPAISRGQIFIRGEKHLYCIEKHK